VDLAGVVHALLPYVNAAAVGSGGAGIETMNDDASVAAADTSVALGRRLLRWLVRRSADAPAIEAAVVEFGKHHGDTDLAAAVETQLMTALVRDPELAREIAEILERAGAVPRGRFTVTASGSRGVQVGNRNTQTNIFGAPPE
jgi:hypothetical protein